MTEHAIEVADLKVYFPTGQRGRFVRALDGVGLSVAEGSFHAIVGESGCGKTTLARVLIGLQLATAGSIRVRGRDIGDWMHDRRHFARQVQFVFQNPLGALSRRQTVRQSLEEPLQIHKIGNASERGDRICQLMERVGLPLAMLDRLPRSLSGGQRQRVAIARALALEPSILICDEPLSALDVSIQAQIVRLFSDLQRDLGLTIVMISHDLAVVREMCSQATVMYLGKVVETGSIDAMFQHPGHPYTEALLSAVPSLNPREEKERRRIVLKGDPPSPMAPPTGCHFHTRCQIAEPQCSKIVPLLEPKRTGTKASCLVIA